VKENLSKIANSNYSLVNIIDGMPAEEIDKCLNHAKSYFQMMSSRFAGYQVNLDMDYTKLFEFLNFSLNNAGDPFIDSNYGVNSRMMERPVLEFVAELFHAIDKNYWGYITSGGSEGNIFAANLARTSLESFSHSTSPDTSRSTPIAYFSQASHYSVPKAVDLLAINSEVIPTTPNDEIDVSSLIAAILRNDPETHPPFIIANIGTSFACAYDNVEEIVAQLDRHNIEQYYIHVDAALAGLVLPFLAEEREFKDRIPVFDFRLPIDSISVSGHKAIGMPFPCGIFMTLRNNLAFGGGKQEEIIGTVDSTLSGSRNGLAAVLLWYAIAERGQNGLKKLANHMYEMSEYAFKVLSEVGCNPWKNELGFSIVFDRPPEWLAHKWSLATVGDKAHIFTMGHVNKTMLNELAEDLKSVKRVDFNSSAQATNRVLDLVHFIKDVSLFAFMSEEQLLTVASLLTERYEGGDVYLCRQGDPGDEMYIIIQGAVDIIVEINGTSHEIDQAGPGDAIGEMAVLVNMPRTATLRVRGNVHLLTIQRADFRSLMQRYPSISDRVIQMMVNRLVTRSYRHPNIGPGFLDLEKINGSSVESVLVKPIPSHWVGTINQSNPILLKEINHD
jgi:histidine decarboxylase